MRYASLEDMIIAIAKNEKIKLGDAFYQSIEIINGINLWHIDGLKFMSNHARYDSKNNIILPLKNRYGNTLELELDKDGHEFKLHTNHSNAYFSYEFFKYDHSPGKLNLLFEDKEDIIKITIEGRYETLDSANQADYILSFYMDIVNDMREKNLELNTFRPDKESKCSRVNRPFSSATINDYLSTASEIQKEYYNSPYVKKRK